MRLRVNSPHVTLPQAQEEADRWLACWRGIEAMPLDLEARGVMQMCIRVAFGKPSKADCKWLQALGNPVMPPDAASFIKWVLNPGIHWHHKCHWQCIAACIAAAQAAPSHDHIQGRVAVHAHARTCPVQGAVRGRASSRQYYKKRCRPSRHTVA